MLVVPVNLTLFNSYYYYSITILSNVVNPDKYNQCVMTQFLCAEGLLLLQIHKRTQVVHGNMLCVSRNRVEHLRVKERRKIIRDQMH